MTEDELVNLAIAGDISALSNLLREYASQLRSAIHIDARWQSLLDVDDVLQVTYLEAFLRIADFKSTGAGTFLSWLRRIADNNLLDAIKGMERQKRTPPGKRLVTPADDSVTELYQLLGVTTTTPSRVAAKQEMLVSLEAALQALPEDYTAVVRAYDLDGRSIGETAALAGRSAGAVHMMRARAHARLRELLGESPNFTVSA